MIRRRHIESTGVAVLTVLLIIMLHQNLVRDHNAEIDEFDALAYVGHPDGTPLTDGQHGDQSKAWKIKRFTNDELRQKFVDATVKQAEHIGLVIPDPKLKWNETKNNGEGGYDFGEIDWDEFWKVVKGHGPMNKDRIAARKKAWEEGAWVREAALAYAQKQRDSQTPHSKAS